MNPLRRYKKYRKAVRKLHQKIIDTCLERDVLMKSASLLGLVRGGTLILENEDEMSILADFALYDYKVNSRNTIEIYREKIGWRNEMERDILDALVSSYTSLFRVISTSEREKTVLLDDILNKKANIKLVDIGLSETAVHGLLLFIRLVSFKDLNMTSGISFIFPGELEKYLLKKYKKLGKKVKSDSDSIKRFVSFFKLNRSDGLEVNYGEVV